MRKILLAASIIIISSVSVFSETTVELSAIADIAIANSAAMSFDPGGFNVGSHERLCAANYTC